MGKVTRKRYSAEVKPTVALEAIEGMSATFSGKSEATASADPAEIERLHAKIGQLRVERDF